MKLKHIKHSDWKSGETKPRRKRGYWVRVSKEGGGFGAPFIAHWHQPEGQGAGWYRYESDDPYSEKTPRPLKDVVHSWANAEDADIEKALARQLRPEELIAQAYENDVIKNPEFQPGGLGKPPASRVFKVGDHVYMGRLKNPRVEAVYEDGEYLVVSYEETKRDGTLGPVTYMGIHWSRVFSQESSSKESVVKPPVMELHYQYMSLREVIAGMYPLNFNPDYQREYAWSDEDKQRYLDSLCEGRDIGRFILAMQEDHDAHFNEVVDGKQRLSLLQEFYTSRIAWRGIFFHAMNPRDRDQLMYDTRVQVVKLSRQQYSRSQLLQLFLHVNAAGVPVEESHLARVRQMLAQEQAREAEEALKRGEVVPGNED